MKIGHFAQNSIGCLTFYEKKMTGILFLWKEKYFFPPFSLMFFYFLK